MKKGYIISPKYISERKADYEMANEILLKWENISKNKAYKDETNEDGLCGNIGSNIRYNPELKKMVLENDERRYHFDDIAIYKTIPASLLLYRLICMIPNPKVDLAGANGYKCPWWVYFKHKKTGKIMAFGEWKGAAGVWTPYHRVEDMHDSYKEDMMEFMNFIISDKSPHPYDRLTAGSVA